MRWWGSKPHSVTAKSPDSAAFFMITLLSGPSVPPFLYLFLDSSFRFYLLPGLSPIALHLSPVDAASHSLFTRFSPPHLSWVRSDRPPGRRPCLPASTTRLRFTLLLGIPSSSFCEPVSALPHPVSPPLLSSILNGHCRT